MTYSTIYALDGRVIADGVQSQVKCDATIITARTIAQKRRESVIVEDYGTHECYRVTPAGRRLKAPRFWPAPQWQVMEDYMRGWSEIET